MRHANRRWIPFCGLAAVLALFCGLSFAAVQSETAPQPESVSGAWQHHQLSFDYFGATTLYTCDGLSDHVRQILLLLGARNDLKVSARGCFGPLSTPSRSVFVAVDFYSLAPAAGEPDAIKAQWAPLEITPRRPNWMGGGDCELMQWMKDLITKNFTWRDIDYRTRCFPHDVSPDGFAIKGQALRALPAPQTR